MEDYNVPLKDPKLLENHPAYITYGPIAICAILHEEYSALKKLTDCPALKGILHLPIIILL